MSFKVICINNGPIKENGVIYTAPELIEGNPYTVIDVSDTGGYFLKEVGIDESIFSGFNEIRFIPTSTIDERELLEQRQSQLA